MVQQRPRSLHQQLVQVVPTSVQEQVVREALAHLNATPTRHKELQRVLSKVTGSKARGLDARMPQLDLVAEGNQRTTQTLFIELLPAWLEVQSPLHQAMQTFLISKRLNIQEPIRLSKPPAKLWRQEEIDEFLTEFRRKNRSFDEGASILMFCCLTGGVVAAAAELRSSESRTRQPELDVQSMSIALPPASEPPSSTPTEGEFVSMHPYWQNWLDELGSVPPNDSRWASASAFLEAFQQLLDAKHREREQGRVELEEALVRLRADAAEEIDIWEYTDIAHWSAEKFSLDFVVAVARQVGTLKDTLIEHAGLRDRPRAKRQADYMREQEELASCAKRVVAIYDDLRQVFADKPSKVVAGDTGGNHQGSEDTIEAEHQSAPGPVAGDVTTQAPTLNSTGAGDDQPAPIPSEIAQDPDDTVPLPEALVEPQGAGAIEQRDESAETEMAAAGIADPSPNNTASVSVTDATVSKHGGQDGADAEPDEVAILMSTATSSGQQALLDRTRIIPSPPSDDTYPVEPTDVVTAASELAPEPGSLEDTVRVQLQSWLGDWSQLPVAYILASWLYQRRVEEERRYGPLNFYDIAYYAFRPDHGPAPIKCPSLEPLYAVFDQPVEAEKAALAWYIAAGLVIVHGEQTALSAFREPTWVQAPHLQIWRRSAEVLWHYWCMSSQPISEARRQLTPDDPDLPLGSLVQAADKVFSVLTRPNHFRMAKWVRMSVHIERELGWVRDALVTGKAAPEMARWAKEFKPDRQLERWVREVEPVNDTFEKAVRRLIVRDLGQFHESVARWLSLHEQTREQRQGRSNTVEYVLRQLNSVLVTEGEVWRQAWKSAVPQLPALANWTQLLLERVTAASNVTEHLAV